MATQNEILEMQKELKKIQEQTGKSRRRAGIGFGLLVFALVLSFVYAFVQQVAATKNAKEALHQFEQAHRFEQLSEANAMEATRLKEMLDECRSLKK